jgi:hypothetical protein
MMEKAQTITHDMHGTVWIFTVAAIFLFSDCNELKERNTNERQNAHETCLEFSTNLKQYEECRETH